MPNRLTRAQLAALTSLHQHDRLWRGDVRDLTMLTLIQAGAARWARVNGLESRTSILPAINAYADGSGVWHVEVPASVHPDDRAAVARAVIRGEVLQRERGPIRPPWVQAEGDDGAGDPAAATHYLYREV